MIDGSDYVIIACGGIVDEAISAAHDLNKKNISCKVVSMHTIKPIDRDLILKFSKQCKKVMTIEDHSIIGGLGSAVSEILSEKYPTLQKRIGLNDIFPESGSPSDLWEKYGLSSKSITNSILQFLN